MTIAPPPCSIICRDGRAGGAQGGEEVQLQRALEVVVADRQEAVEPQPHAADVVDEHVEPAVPSIAVRDQALGAVGRDEVDRDRA